MKIHLFLIISILLSVQLAFGQVQGEPIKKKYTISGYVKEAGSGELLIGATVYIPSLKVGTATNGYGFYSITLELDTFQLIVSYVGYSAKAFQINLSENISLDIDISASNSLEEVQIVASRKQKISESTRMSVIEIPIQQIKDIPALLGEKDALKVIQLMPGVQSGSEGNSGLYVRGGGPDQNLIILDDATVYNAYHLFGFFSLFNGDALNSIELTKGGFPARYGGRLSSVLDMKMKEGNKEEFKGEVGVGVLSSRLTLEGPIKKGKSSFLVSGRRTYIDALTRPFMSADEQFGYYFYDLNAKVNYDFGRKNKIYLSGYFGKDQASAKFDGGDEESKLFWGNITGTARWNHLFNEQLFANTSFIVSNYDFGISNISKYDNDEYEFRTSSGIRDYALKIDLDYRPSPKHSLRAGLISTYHIFTPSSVVLKDEAIGSYRDDKTTIKALENGAYIEDDFTITDRLKLNGGIRFSHFLNEDRNYFRAEPRISGRYFIGEDLSLKASYANMNQYIHLLTQTGLGLPTDLWVPATKRVAPQQSNQWAIGVAKDLSKHDLTISIETYYKKSENVIAYKEGASFLALDAFDFDDEDEDTDEGLKWENNITSGQAWSYGAEFLIQKKVGRFSGWIGYTLSFTQFQFDSLNNGAKFWARYDRRHDISVVGIYQLKENKESGKRITLSATWVYGTGNAITLPESQYRAGTNIENGNYYNQVSEYSAVNDFRMAPYHRLDFGAQFHKKKKRGERTWEVSFYNLYNRQNPFFYYSDTDIRGKTILKQVSLFPILPSISYTFKF